MFFPISDSPNPQGIPYATWAIIALNVVVFLFINVPLGTQPVDVNDPAYPEYMQFLSQYVGSTEELALAAQQITDYDLFVFKHGYRPAAPSALDLVFSMFLHGGLMHLLGNMLFLFIYGNNVEHRLGAVWFVVWYLLTGVAATMFHAAFFSASDVPLVGASGAISGVLGFYFIWFPRNMVRVLVFLPPFIMQTFQVGARLVLAAYLVLDNLVPFFLAGEGGVAHGAHIGGFLAGGAVAMLMGWRAVSGAPADIKSPAKAVSVASQLREQGQSDKALALLQRVIRSAPRAAGVAEAYALAGSILLDDRHDAPAAYQYLVAALQLGPTPETTAEIRRGLDVIESQQKLHVGRMRRRGR